MSQLNRRLSLGIAIEAGIAGLIAVVMATEHDAIASILFLGLFAALRLLSIAIEAVAKSTFSLGRLQGQLVSMVLGMSAIGAVTASYAFLTA